MLVVVTKCIAFKGPVARLTYRDSVLCIRDAVSTRLSGRVWFPFFVLRLLSCCNSVDRANPRGRTHMFSSAGLTRARQQNARSLRFFNPLKAGLFSLIVRPAKENVACYAMAPERWAMISMRGGLYATSVTYVLLLSILCKVKFNEIALQEAFSIHSLRRHCCRESLAVPYRSPLFVSKLGLRIEQKDLCNASIAVVISFS